MKTLIVGTGIIGTIYGWALSEAGIDVMHYVRSGRAKDFQEPVAIDLLDERKGYAKHNKTQYALKCAEKVAPSDRYDLIIVPTAAQQTEIALQTLVPVSGQATFLIMSGNWEGTAFIDRLLPRERYLMGYADGGGTVRDGVYWTNLGSEVHLGAVGNEAEAKLQQVKATFVQAGMTPDVQENIVHWLWAHTAGVIGYSAGFAKYRDLDCYLQDAELLRRCTRSTRELYALCERRGVNLKRYPETMIRRLPTWLVVRLLRRNFRRIESMQRYTAHAASDGSLAETKYYFDAVMKNAQEYSFAMPDTQALGEYLRHV